MSHQRKGSHAKCALTLSWEFRMAPDWGTFQSHPHIEGTFTGTLVNVGDLAKTLEVVLVNVLLRFAKLRQIWPHFARRRARASNSPCKKPDLRLSCPIFTLLRCCGETFVRLLLPNRGAIRSSNEMEGVFSEHAQESGCYKALTVLTLQS